MVAAAALRSGPSKRKEIFYFAESTLGAVRINDFKYSFITQPNGWLGGTVKVDWPLLTNIRLDPFERTGLTGSLQYESFNMEGVKEQILKAIAAHQGQ
jgi:arylsulfatase